MNVSKILVFAFGAFMALSVVVLTIRQIAIKDVAHPALAIINAKVTVSDKTNVSAMLLKHDKIVAIGMDDEILQQAPQEVVIIDMQGKQIAPGQLTSSATIENATKSGVTTLVIDVNDEQANEYFWGRQHGLYNVRLALSSSDMEIVSASDHKFIVNNDPNYMNLLGDLDVGKYADFVVLDNDKLVETWVGAVKVYQTKQL